MIFRRILIYGIALWLGGLLWFVVHLPKAHLYDGRHVDGIVALTGGEGRIKLGLMELENHRAKRMLISGVHKGTTAEALAERNDAPRSLFDCCVDIGYGAGDTIGNGAEAAAWVQMHHFQSIKLVTSRSHMPRAMLEFSDRMPDTEIMADPVSAGFQPVATLIEYNKYYLRLIWLRLA